MQLEAFCTKVKVENQEQTYFMMYIPDDQPPTIKDKVQIIALKQVTLKNIPTAKELHALVTSKRLVCMSGQGKVVLGLESLQQVASRVVIETSTGQVTLPNRPICRLNPPGYAYLAENCEKALAQKLPSVSAAAAS